MILLEKSAVMMSVRRVFRLETKIFPNFDFYLFFSYNTQMPNFMEKIETPKISMVHSAF